MAVLAIAAVFCASCAEAPRVERPNIVFIMMDDLGWGDLSCYGSTKIRTPSVDRMAAEGLRFTSYYASSAVCAPTRCSLMTGKHTGHAFVRDNKEVGEEGQLALPAGTMTLPRVLRDRGYRTGVVGKWALGGPGSTGVPGAQGVDFFYGYLCQRKAHNHYPPELWRNGVREGQGAAPGAKDGVVYAQDAFIREAEGFIRENKDRPFFLYLPWIIPHLALQVPEADLAEYAGAFPETPYDGKKGYRPHATPRAAYAAMVTRADKDVGRLLGLLKELELDEKTIVFFCSDNGGTMDVGGADTPFFRSNGPWRATKGDLYEGGIRVPMVARWPGHVPAGRVTETPAVAYDMMRTVLSLTGMDGGAAATWGLDGVDLSPVLLGGGSVKRDHLTWEFTGYGAQQAVRMGDWKGLRRGMGKGNMKVELYDLSKDPGETRDVAGEHPGVVARIEEIMRTDRTPSKEFPLPGVDAPAKASGS